MADFMDDYIKEYFESVKTPKDRITEELREEYRCKLMFRIKSLTVLHHPVLGNLHLDFCQEEEEPRGLYTSVIIGANGIGKSYILRAIAEIFCCLENLFNEKEPDVPQYYFDVVYSTYWETMEFANFRDFNAVEHGRRRYTQFVFKCQGKETEEVKRLMLPQRVIASATTISDKYLAKSTEMYRYKGLRNEKSPSSTGTRTMVRKTVDGLLNSLDIKTGFSSQLKDLLPHLGLQPRLELSYSMRYIDVFVKENMTGEMLQQIFENQEGHFKRGTKLWGTRNFEKIRDEDRRKLKVAANFFRKIARNGFDDGRRVLKYDLLEDVQRVSEDREALKILSDLDLLTYPSLKVWKNEGNYEFDKSSSGESSLLCQMVGIMSDIEPNSLVLIDEPENSAHPNWQMSYIEWLKNIFEKYYNCHFIISTHSHFMLTNLQPETSDIVVLERQDGNLMDVSDGVNTFNWSVDDILYRVFHVRNTRNYVFEGKVVELYKLVSGRGDRQKIKELTNELSMYQLNGDDPIMKLLDTAKDYVKSE